MRSVILLVAGLVLLVVAFIVNSQADSRDMANVRHSIAVNDFGRSLGTYDYVKPEKQDRTLVYVLAGGGGLCLLGAVVCLWYRGNRERDGPEARLTPGKGVP